MLYHTLIAHVVELMKKQRTWVSMDSTQATETGAPQDLGVHGRPWNEGITEATAVSL